MITAYLTQKHSRTMGLDVGDARVGIALSDPLGITAQPLTTVTRQEAYKEIVALVEKHNICTIVVGDPIELDGTVGQQANKVHKFIAKLQLAITNSNTKNSNTDTPIQIILCDERLTTVQAQRALVGSNLKNKQRSAALDKISAAIILQSYLDNRRQ